MTRGYTKRLIRAALKLKERAAKQEQGVKKEIIIETHKVFVVHRQGSFQSRCVACAETVEMVKPDDAAALLQISLRRIFRRVEAEKLHFTETANGSLLICRNSLMNFNDEGIGK
jgi:hypothetical protein